MSRRALVALAGVVLSGLGWLLAAPAALGGSATWVATRGTSMEPGFRTGDLAVVRPAASYAVGDVVAYRSVVVNRVVMHRIVRRDAAGFVLKGDNNDWIDPETVAPSAVVGRLSLRVPRGGVLLAVSGTPAAAVLVALVLAAGPRPRRPKEPAMPVRNVPALAVAGALGALTAVAFAAPGTVPGSRDTGLRHEASVGYEARVAADSLYQDGAVDTGDPVFRDAVPDLAVRVGYRLAGPASGVSGTLTPVAVVRTDSGWTHRVPLGPPVRFTGTTASAAPALRLRELDALVAGVAERTGRPAASYRVELTAAVTVAGDAAGTPFAAGAEAPPLELVVEPRLVRPAGDLPEAAPAGISAQAPVPSKVRAGRWAVDLRTARAVGVVATLAAVVLALFVPRRRRPGEPAGASRRLVDVTAIRFPPDRNVVEVSTPKGLLALAERYDRPVLHEVRGDVHSYVVEADRSLYRYRYGPRVTTGTVGQEMT